MRLRVTVLEDVAALLEHHTAWQDLAASAIEPNIFYEPWMFLPAFDEFGHRVSGRFVLIFAEEAGPPARTLLCGFFPVEKKSKYKAFPCSQVRLWMHHYCFLGTPLVHRAYARECLTAFMGWLRADPAPSLMVWRLIAVDGPFFQALSGVLNANGPQPSFVAERHARALLRPRADAEVYLQETLPAKRRKELRRLEKRLGELGTLEYVELTSGSDPGPWIESFMALEAKGWKGRGRSALASSREGHRFFTRAATDAARIGRLMMIGLELNGQPIALKCNFLSGEGSFSFKIAFDETHRRFSPGVLLELENIRRVHAFSSPRWMDSCATPEHFMANHLWMDRRTVATVVTSAGRASGDVAISLMPWVRRLSRAFRGSTQP